MNYDNTKYLFDTYPQLFKPEARSNSLMRFGFSCDDGWFDLLHDLCNGLSSYTDIEIIQVKEKFGMLRVYYSFTNLESFTEEIKESMRKFVSEIENKSAHVCEVCGKKGKLRNELPWIKTLCIKHLRSKTAKVIDEVKVKEEYRIRMLDSEKTFNYIQELIKLRTV